jgi:F-type H+-transporting ATPase subunit b
MEIFEKLGIDWRLLVAQLVNFAILMAALLFFVYKPLIKVLEGRQEKIAESLRDAERIGEELRGAEAKSLEILAAARAEAGKIVDQARVSAEAAKTAAVEKAKAEVAVLVAGGKRQLASERDAMLLEVRGAAAELVGRAVEKVIGEKMNDAKGRQLVEKTLEGI